MFTLHATGSGHGLCFGRAHIFHRPGSEIPEYNVHPEAVEAEVRRLRAAIDAASDAMQNLRDNLDADAPEEMRAILGVQQMMLEDPTLVADPIEQIRREHVNAESALQKHGRQLLHAFEALDDPYLAARSGDVGQIVERVLGQLTGVDRDLDSLPEQLGSPPAEIVVVAHDLSPEDLLALSRRGIGGFVTSLGGATSHSTILARSLGLVAVVGLPAAVRYLCSGDHVVLDGMHGIVVVEPDSAALDTYHQRRRRIAGQRAGLARLRESEARTLDGQRIGLYANIQLAEELDAVHRERADGIGLFRTEFLFMNRPSPPDEAEQYRIYRGLVEQSGCPVTLRTLDIGADKPVAAASQWQEDNPSTNSALGLRALRWCLHDLSLFKPQLRAIYRASAAGATRLLLPMLSTLEELEQVHHVLAEVRAELTEQKLPFDPDLPVGAMIEVPAAALCTDALAPKLDFFAIGSNDLLQYTLAVDRLDDSVNYLYDPLHPSLLKLLQMTVQAANRHDLPVSVCGRMAGEPEFTRVLLGLGLRELSMVVSALQPVKRVVRGTDIARTEPLVAQLLDTPQAAGRRELLAEINA